MADSQTIKAIEPSTVHQIQSGQVIVDLCSVAKELVENSLDAGATNIEVRFKNQGLDLIEVQDNGSGISQHNYESLALKHYTSKLSTYADLTSLQTFGFRGEALSSLCALSNFTVTTCLKGDVPKGTKLEFETSGKLKGTSVVACQPGTTVTVEKIFKNLPVRRRELERNIKREWGKVVALLNQYACIQTGVKFSVSQQPNKGKRIVLFSTKGNPSTRDNIINVFGAKTMSALITLDLHSQLQPTVSAAQKWAGQSDGAKDICIRGHVSRPAHGEGRQTPDRQMFYVNGRPCHLPQFAKVFNEVYKSYNVSQSPFIFADIQLDTHLYDVNVSPDKRSILLHDQGKMLDDLRESLTELFEMQDVTVPISQHPTNKTPSSNALYPTPRDNSRSTRDSQKTSVSQSPPINGEPITTASHIDEVVTDDENSGRGSLRSNRTSRSQDPIPVKSGGSALLASWVQKTSGSERRISGSKDTQDGSQDQQGVRVEVMGGFGEVEEDATPSRDAELSSPPSQESVDLRPVDESTSPSEDVRVGSDDLGEAETNQQYRASETPIPSVTTPSRSQTMRIVRISPPRRLKRSSPGVATITIGDETIVTALGPTTKRARVDNSSNGKVERTQASKKPKDSAPSFGGRLTQMFAAASSLIDVSTEATGSAPGTVALHEREVADGRVMDVDEESSEQELNSPSLSAESSPGVTESPPEVQATGPDRSSTSPTASAHGSADDLGGNDDDYVDENEKKTWEDIKVQEMIRAAENEANTPTDHGEKRGQMFIKSGFRRKDSTLQVLQRLKTEEASIRRQLDKWQSAVCKVASNAIDAGQTGGIDAADAEEKLSLSISKCDFDEMRIIGQFNLGFIIAVREAVGEIGSSAAQDDELFIIDQHASDEKYNFERLQAHTVVQSQRLVQPKTLELTAIEEEIIIENQSALEANGFMVSVDESGDLPVGSRCQLVALPLSRETTFSLADLEELISLLADHTSITAVPRPSRVRKMFAMRACRSSIMVGKALSQKQMEKVVRHMGGMEKPWNCPHGRPTMRHLCGLSVWDGSGWREGDAFDEADAPIDWAAYVRDRS